MERIKKILGKQWKMTPLWTKFFAALVIVWSGFYFVDAGLIFFNQTPLTITGQTFTMFTLILKIIVGIQMVLLVAHLLEIGNQKTVANPNIRNFTNKVRAYFRKVHPLLGISALMMALSHSLWNFARFLSFSWPWSLQIISGVVGIIVILLVALSGDGALLAPGQKRQKVILVHTILALVFLVPFFVHI